jgi:hypothetical protein
MEKCRKHATGVGPTSSAWVASLLILANKLSNEEHSRKRQKLQLALAGDGQEKISLAFDILALVFTYLSPQVAARLQGVSRKWHALQTLHVVPWTIGPHAFLQLPRSYARIRPTAKDKVSILTSGFTKNAISFCFGSAAPTPMLMQCIELMPELQRLQMPTYTDAFRDTMFAHRYVEQLVLARGLDITHLAVSLRPCISAIRRFPRVTSLLVSFGIAAPVATLITVESFIRTVAVDPNVLPNLQHLGLHHCSKISDISVKHVVTLLQDRPALITLSLTGMFYITPDEIRGLLHPACGLRSLAINVPLDDDGVSWQIDEILYGSRVSLLVLCLPDAGDSTLLPKSLLWTMFVAGFKPLRARNVRIDGQRSYEAHPFRRLAAVDDVVWGLTGGSIFAA